MKAMIVLILCATISTLALFGDFQKEISKLDEKCPTDFSCSLAERWWAECDIFSITLFNGYFKNDEPNEAINTISIPSGYSIHHDNNETIMISMKPKGHGGEISIEIVSLGNKAYLLNYSRVWNEKACQEGRIISVGTIRIIRLNKKTKTYFIDQRLEDTNFFKYVMNSKKYKYISEQNIPSCEWMWQTGISDVLIEDNKSYFTQGIVLGLAGSPLQNVMKVNWEYSPGKLKALNYRYKSGDFRYDPNVNISTEVREGKTIPISP
jgi:hypothetical protein